MTHAPTDPDYLDQMPMPVPPQPREHIWQGTSDECAKCWCQPFAYPDCGVIEDGGWKPMWLHRPHGCVFWEHGEQGPQWDYGPVVFADLYPFTDIDKPFGLGPDGE